MKPSQEQMVATITAIVSEWTGGRGNAAPFISFAMRESALKPEAIGDDGETGLAAKAWKREKPRFVRAGNPWAATDRLWWGSLGLYQLMPANHLDRWDMLAAPQILHDPVISTIVAGRFFNKAAQMGAQTLLDARMVWAFGPKGLKISKSSREYVRRLKTEKERLKSLGFSPELATAPLSSLHLDGFGVGPQEGQQERVDKFSGTTPQVERSSFPLVLAVLTFLFLGK